MDHLLEGMTRFQTETYPPLKHLYTKLAASQHPHTLIICCADSRVVPNDMLHANPGELFVCRNAGNIVPPYGDSLGGVSATVEYAVHVLKVQHIVVCGHSDCGAMRAVMHPEKVQHMRAVAQWIRHADRVSAVARELHGDANDADLLNRLIEENVITQLDNLITHPCVASKVRSRNLSLHGMVFDIEKGEFFLLERQTHTFVPLATWVSHGTGKLANV